LNLNKIVMIGRAIKAPDKREAGSSTVATFRLVSNRRYKKSKDSDYTEEATFVDVDCWNQKADFVLKHVQKGTILMVEGRLKQDNWTAQDGSNRSKLKITADNVEVDFSKRDDNGGGRQPVAASAGPSRDTAGDDLPF